MASLTSIYVKREKIEELLALLSDNDKGIELTVSLRDSANEYGKNATLQVAQSKEDREKDIKPTVLGYGITFWSKDETPVFKSTKN